MYQIYNYKTGVTVDRLFETKRDAKYWIDGRKAETSIKLYWRIRKVPIGKLSNPLIHKPDWFDDYNKLFKTKTAMISFVKSKMRPNRNVYYKQLSGGQYALYYTKEDLK